MGVPKGFVVISAVVRREVRDRLRQAAAGEKSSVSAMLAKWIAGGADAPLLLSKAQKVRAVKDELMVSLPMDFIHRTALRKMDVVTVSYSDFSVLVSVNKV